MPLGQFAHVGLVKEAAWGTALAATDYIPIISESVVHEIEQIEDSSIRGSTRGQLPSLPGMETAKGDIVAEARPITLGYLLHSALGDPTTTGLGPYIHTFKPRMTEFSSACFLQPYTLELFRDLAQSFQISGAAINTLQLAFGTDQKLTRVTAGIIGKAIALIAKTSPSFETANPFQWKQAVVKFAANVAGLAGASAHSELEKASIKLDNKMEGISLLNNSAFIGKIKPSGLMTCELDLTAEADASEYAKFSGQQIQAMEVTFTAGTDVLKITLPAVKYTAYPVNVSGPGRIVVGIKGKAFYSAADSYMIEVKLTNSKASYIA